MKQLLTLAQTKGRPGRPPAILAEHLPKIEKLAALGLNDTTIAAHLGVAPKTLRESKNGVENSAVSAALEKGRLAAIERVAQRVDDWAVKNPIVTMYQAKAILGRHDTAWTDAKQGAAGGGVEIKITVSRGLAPEVEAIEADFEEIR